MSSGSMNGSSTPTGEARRDRSKPRGASGDVMPIKRLDELIGAHPAALRELFASGRATDPEELGRAPRGLILAIEPAREVHFLVRPFARAMASGAMPWKGKTFGPDGFGKNLVGGRAMIQFAYETGTSDVDGGPALILRYDVDGNSWPIRNVRDELRTIGHGVAVGPALFSATASGARKVVAWFGLERAG